MGSIEDSGKLAGGRAVAMGNGESISSREDGGNGQPGGHDWEKNVVDQRTLTYSVPDTEQVQCTMSVHIH